MVTITVTLARIQSYINAKHSQHKAGAQSSHAIHFININPVCLGAGIVAHTGPTKWTVCAHTDLSPGRDRKSLVCGINARVSPRAACPHHCAEHTAAMVSQLLWGTWRLGTESCPVALGHMKPGGRGPAQSLWGTGRLGTGSCPVAWVFLSQFACSLLSFQTVSSSFNQARLTIVSIHFVWEQDFRRDGW